MIEVFEFSISYTLVVIIKSICIIIVFELAEGLIIFIFSVPRLASAVTLARARARSAGPPWTVQQPSHHLLIFNYTIQSKEGY